MQKYYLSLLQFDYLLQEEARPNDKDNAAIIISFIFFTITDTPSTAHVCVLGVNASRKIAKQGVARVGSISQEG